MHVVLVEPRFPTNQKLFVKALAEVGATVTAIGEGSKASLDGDLRRRPRHYAEVRKVTDHGQLRRAVRKHQWRAPTQPLTTHSANPATSPVPPPRPGADQPPTPRQIR